MNPSVAGHELGRIGLWLLLATFVGAGCYSPSPPDCAWRCAGADSRCPAGLACYRGYCAAGPDTCNGDTIGEVGDAPCTPGEQPVAPVVYVSAMGVAQGATPNGSTDLPYLTIAAAFAKARLTNAQTIVIDEGTYLEDITLENFVMPVVLDGAWIRSMDGGEWTRDCSTDRRTKTVVRSTTDVGVRVQGQAAVPVTLSNLTIETPPAQATPADTSGASRYGIFIDNSLVKLTNVRVVAEAGGHGGAASDGAGGMALCTTSTTCTAVPAEGTNQPDAPPASTFGSFEATGFVPADGASGDDGTDGTNGTASPGPKSRGDCEVGCACGASNCPSTAGTVSSTAGTCGCGGSKGTRGQPGRGGGASIAVYVVGAGALVQVSYSELVAMNGGNGSAGGSGGVGGEPTMGAPGTPAACWPLGRCCTTGAGCGGGGCYHPASGSWPTQFCGAQPTAGMVAGGEPGGAGKAGGKGASAGGGAGGPAFSYVTIGGAGIELLESSRAFGVGGLGAGGARDGSPGEHP